MRSAKKRKDTATATWTDIAGRHADHDRQALRPLGDLHVRALGEGAMGLIINQRAPHISFRELLGQLSISTRDPDR